MPGLNFPVRWKWLSSLQKVADLAEIRVENLRDSLDVPDDALDSEKWKDLDNWSRDLKSMPAFKGVQGPIGPQGFTGVQGSAAGAQGVSRPVETAGTHEVGFVTWSAEPPTGIPFFVHKLTFSDAVSQAVSFISTALFTSSVEIVTWSNRSSMRLVSGYKAVRLMKSLPDFEESPKHERDSRLGTYLDIPVIDGCDGAPNRLYLQYRLRSVTIEILDG
jgi:hypothetical protein